jgi:hypothetical protein
LQSVDGLIRHKSANIKLLMISTSHNMYADDPVLTDDWAATLTHICIDEIRNNALRDI